MPDTEVKKFFRDWRKTDACPWYVKEQYLEDNGQHARGGAGPAGKKRNVQENGSGALPPDEYDAKIDALLHAQDFTGAAVLQHQQRVALGEVEPPLENVIDEDATDEGSETEHSSSAEEKEDKENDRETQVLKMLYKGNMEEISRREQQEKGAKVYNRKHNYYRNTRCTCMAQEEQSAIPAGVFNVYEDSDDEDAYLGEQRELQKEMQELLAAKDWINQKGWDVASEAQVVSPSSGKTIDLRLDWAMVEQKLKQGYGDLAVSDAGDVDEVKVLSDFSLDKLDPTQRVFADRVLKWGDELVDVHETVKRDGRGMVGDEDHPLPILRIWLGGSAGSGKSTTLKTCVQHLRLKFYKSGVLAKVELTAYTGVAAFNIGFGARTVCSAFQIFPNAAWKHELEGNALRNLEDTWDNVVLLIVDEVSFIGRALFARMHFRLQQAKRPYFTERSIDPAAKLFGDISIILVGDFGQLEPIDDWSMCDTESNWATCPKNIKHLWSHARFGKLLTETFQEAIMLKQIHRSKEDLWWTESCLRLRDFTCTFEGDWAVWKQHDLDREHLNKEQVEYFENKALWLCARCEDVGQRNGRKLAEIAEKEKQLIHQIYAIHSHKSAKKCTASVFDGLRGVVNLARGCKVVLTRNVAYKFGLANGTRGIFISAVYGPGGVGTFPEALICEFPDYCGDHFYKDEPKWVPIVPKVAYKDKSKMSRTQFPLVAGFALTVNKAQGLTVKEGVVIHLVGGSCKFKPASKHGLPFVVLPATQLDRSDPPPPYQTTRTAFRLPSPHPH